MFVRLAALVGSMLFAAWLSSSTALPWAAVELPLSEDTMAAVVAAFLCRACLGPPRMTAPPSPAQTNVLLGLIFLAAVVAPAWGGAPKEAEVRGVLLMGLAAWLAVH